VKAYAAPPIHGNKAIKWCKETYRRECIAYHGNPTPQPTYRNDFSAQTGAINADQVDAAQKVLP
jgi:hypothetical protein